MWAFGGMKTLKTIFTIISASFVVGFIIISIQDKKEKEIYIDFLEYELITKTKSLRIYMPIAIKCNANHK